MLEKKGGVMLKARCARNVPGVLRAAVVAALMATAALGPARRASAQLPQTRLYALSPCGGQAGSSFDVKIASGDDLDDLKSLVFNHAGIKAVPKTRKSGGKTLPVANTFVVTVDAGVPTGLYEVRAAGKFGLSNPRTFVVGRFSEAAEKESNDSADDASAVAINQTVNGVIGGTADIDFYRFQGKKGQQVTVDCRAARIDSRLRAALELFSPAGQRLVFSRNDVRNDPVITAELPSDGTYVVKLYDFTYRGGADYFYRLSVHTAPRIDFVLPTSGLPGTKSRFTLYGRNLPGGQPSQYKIAGQSLQKVEVDITLPSKPNFDGGDNLSPREAGVDAVNYVWKSPNGDSNPVLIHLADAQVVVEQEPNDDPKTAQTVTLPVEVSGHFQDRGDVDYVTFQAKAKEIYFIEVYSQRLGTTADAYLKIEQVTKTGKGGESVRTIASSDDTSTNLAANIFDTATDDPVYRFQVPADGTYRISLRDRYYEARGDPRLVYRLSIRRPKPDFRVVILPETPARQRNQPTTTGVLALRKGENLAARVLAFRKDGFDGKIDIIVDGLPPGVVCKGGSIGPGQTSTFLVFSTTEKAAEWSGLIRVRATAETKGPPEKFLEQEVRPATIAWSGNRNTSPNIARVARSLGLSVLKESAPVQLTTDVFRVEANQGRQILIPTKLARRNGFKGNVAVTVDGLPRNSGIQIQNKQIAQGKDSELFQAFIGTRAKPGVYTLFLKSTVRFAYRKNLDKVAEAKTVQAEAAKAVKQAADAAKAAEAALAAAAKKAAADAAALQSARAAETAAKKNLAAAEAALKQAAAEKAKADKMLADATAAHNTAAAKLAAAKKAAEATPDDKTAAAAVATAEKELADRQAKLKTAQAAQKDAAAKVTAAQAAVKSAADSVTAATKAVAEAKSTAKTSADAKAKAEAAVKTAQVASKSAAAAKQDADRKLKAANDAAKPKNVNLYPASTPVIIEVKKAPAQLTAAVSGGGNLKRGGKLDIKVTVKRLNGFKGPVELSLPLPPGTSGLTAPAVTIPADKTTGVLTVQAGGNATTGQLAHMVVRGTMQFDGKAAVDAPVTIKVAK